MTFLYVFIVLYFFYVLKLQYCLVCGEPEVDISSKFRFHLIINN